MIDSVAKTNPGKFVTKVPEPLSAAILAGGASRRMGRDKAFLQLAPAGPPLVAIVLERLRAVAEDVQIVANDPDRFGFLDTRVVPDLQPGSGTLAGIQAAIHHARHRHCLVVACDMPFLNFSLLSMMARQTRDYDVLAPLLPGTSKQGMNGVVFQTLHAIYSKACLPSIERQLNAGNRQVIGFFEHVNVRTLSMADVVAFDRELLSFFNANSPDALEQARAIAARMEPFPVE